jgi:DNA-binding NarL/FixJ family response regulator
MDTSYTPAKTVVTGVDKQTFVKNRKIRILIVDDHPGVRAGTRNLLSAAKDMVVVGEAGTGAEAIEQIAINHPDIVLLDMELPDQRGDQVMSQIHVMQPDLKVLALSSYTDRDYILGMMEHGAAGYITKDEAPTMLIEAIRTVIEKGSNWFSPQAVKNSSPTALEQQTLTQREVQILQQLVRDRSMEEIGMAVGINKMQVDKYLKLLMKKYETESLESLKQMARRIFLRRS